MKLIISLLVMSNLYAGHVIQINYSSKNHTKAYYVQQHFISEYKIPKHLIKVVPDVCKEPKGRIIYICIEADGSLNFRQKNSELISSLRIFNRPY